MSAINNVGSKLVSNHENWELTYRSENSQTPKETFLSRVLECSCAVLFSPFSFLIGSMAILPFSLCRCRVKMAPI